MLLSLVSHGVCCMRQLFDMQCIIFSVEFFRTWIPNVKHTCQNTVFNAAISPHVSFFYSGDCIRYASTESGNRGGREGEARKGGEGSNSRPIWPTFPLYAPQPPIAPLPPPPPREILEQDQRNFLLFVRLEYHCLGFSYHIWLKFHIPQSTNTVWGQRIEKLALGWEDFNLNSRET